MSEPKLCIFRPTDRCLNEDGTWAEDFEPCLQDKCAMWRITTVVVGYEVVYPDGPLGKIYENVGFCGLAWKP